jgi:predicted TIM-barrel fold metal-dependent hydrolase
VAIIDAQVHAYERDHPGRPWAATLAGPPQVTGDDMVAAMDDVGVDGALLVSPWTMYRFDWSYAAQVGAAHPGRFGLIAPIDPRLEGIEEAVAEWAAVPGAIGTRVMLWGGADAPDASHPGVNLVLSASGQRGLPVCVLGWGKLEQIDELIGRHPETRVVVDHLGLMQPFEPPPPDEPFADLPQLLALARHPNAFVKVTGACTLSHRPYPFDDLWEPLGRVFDAFGIDRCMWGTDWTRAVAVVSYHDAVNAFRDTDRLSEGDRAALMGGTAERLFGWSPSR